MSLRIRAFPLSPKVRTTFVPMVYSCMCPRTCNASWHFGLHHCASAFVARAMVQRRYGESAQPRGKASAKSQGCQSQFGQSDKL